MDNKKNRDGDAKILYVVLAALVVTVIVVSVVSAANKRNKKPSAPLETTPVTSPPIARPRVTARADIPTQPPEDTKAPKVEPPETERVTEAETKKPVIGQGQQASSRSYVVPAEGEVMKDFSVDMPVYSVTMNDYRAHKGIDISCPIGGAVFSFTDGVVDKIYDDPMMGTTVIIDHGDGLRSCYGNLQKERINGIEAGVEVKAGDVIGAVGDTTLIEMAEGSHLHFELVQDEKYIDPSSYLPVLKGGNTEE